MNEQKPAGEEALKKPSAGKSKAIAVFLAVVLAFWAWLYTYKRDAWKFWVNLLLTVITIGIWTFVAWVWAIVDRIVKPAEFYTDYPNKTERRNIFLTLVVILSVILAIGIVVLSIKAIYIQFLPYAENFMNM